MAYTTINKSTDYFNTLTYTGGSGDTAHTGVGFQPDLVWIKERTRARNHAWFDVIRGPRYWLGSNSSDAQDYNSGAYLVSFDSDGFTTTDTDVVGKNGYTYASWNWKAGGTGSANSDGATASTVSVNNTAGFSIVKWTGTSGNTTVGHGMNTAPVFTIAKNYGGSGSNWIVYHKDISPSHAVKLNTTAAKDDGNNYWQSTAPTNSVFTFTGNTASNSNGNNMIAYCFAEKRGYSKFGSYVGNGNADGAFIYTGFKPGWVLWKRTDATNGWYLLDTVREPNNGNGKYLLPTETDAEQNDSSQADLLSNGFKLRNTDGSKNATNGTYIYMAFAEAPLVGSNNIPCTAR